MSLFSPTCHISTAVRKKDKTWNMGSLTWSSNVIIQFLRLSDHSVYHLNKIMIIFNNHVSPQDWRVKIIQKTISWVSHPIIAIIWLTQLSDGPNVCMIHLLFCIHVHKWQETTGLHISSMTWDSLPSVNTLHQANSTITPKAKLFKNYDNCKKKLHQLGRSIMYNLLALKVSVIWVAPIYFGHVTRGQSRRNRFTFGVSVLNLLL